MSPDTPSRTAKFNNPFQGKPKPVELTGFCMLDPEVIWRLLGIPFSRMFADQRASDLYKRLQRMTQGKQPFDPALIREMHDRFDVPDALREPFEEAMRRSDGLMAELARTGPWHQTLLAVSYPNPLDPPNTFLVLAERASRAAEHQAKKGTVSDAAECLAQDGLWAHVLWPEALERLRDTRSLEEVNVLRYALALEVHFAFLMACEWDAMSRGGEGFRSVLLDVMPSRKAPGRNPTSLLYDWLTEAVCASSMNEILDAANLGDDSPDISTLKRWSAGTKSPTKKLLRKLAATLLNEEQTKGFWARRAAARHLSLLGLIGSELLKHAQPFPHGFECFEDWAESRYAFWLDFHRCAADAKRYQYSEQALAAAF
ncbi:hypothetical protein OPU71_00565 [Niveibacterium sp. 24ML]|uniref:hypothetical protein n=1 Tax=Niveibacterium sp. 24ML TaxID=2985512 RepID=UPI00226E40DC|nr:hypothetical protein [Niveibacterium sp. 24ML]MCX9154610.1 hypothetical protein [Niveibacterium sp. 24ML]